MWSTMIAPFASAGSASPDHLAHVVVVADAERDQLGARHGVGDRRGRPALVCSAAQRSALAGVRLNTATSWPARARWPAIG